jgi:hypothetical protein
MTALTKYLSLYAEKETLQLANFSGQFQQGLVIPVYREDISVLERFTRFAEANPGTLLIMVLNQPQTDSDTLWCQGFFSPPLPQQWQSPNDQLQQFELANASSLLLVDRCLLHPPIPDKQGVGLARKIGADLLCELIHVGKVSNPWIYNTDADAHLPADYFNATASYKATTAATLYPFEHCFEHTELNPLTTLLYEFSLHYYVAGLQWAGSSYAYQTLGSIIAVNHQAYAKVRGFPKRAGAEDFYLLNKIAKTGDIVSLDRPVIEIEARESSRVPFGTGPAVQQLAQLDLPTSMALYHPDSFVYLKAFLAGLERYAETGKGLSYADTGIDTDLLDTIAKDMGIEQALAHANRQGKDKTRRLQHLQQWFDGFKTLKLIHQLRNRKLGTRTFEELHNSTADSPYQEFITPRMRALLKAIAQQA